MLTDNARINALISNINSQTALTILPTSDSTKYTWSLPPWSLPVYGFNSPEAALLGFVRVAAVELLHRSATLLNADEDEDEDEEDEDEEDEDEDE